MEIPQDPVFGQQNKQISELQFDKSLLHNHLEVMLWIKEEEMVDSLEELKSSQSVAGKNLSKLRRAGRKDCLCSEQDHPEFPLQEEGQSRGTESPERGPVSTRKTDRFHDL